MKNGIVLIKPLVSRLLLLLITFTLVACGGPPTTAPPSESEKSEVAQKSIQGFLESAKKTPKSAEQELSVLMESLDAYATEYEGPYIELRDSAKELLGLYQSKAAKDKIKAQLEVLQQKADALNSGT